MSTTIPSIRPVLVSWMQRTFCPCSARHRRYVGGVPCKVWPGTQDSIVTSRAVFQNDRSRPGMVMLLVVIVVMMISLAGLSFVAIMFTENKAVRLRGDELQVSQLVESGVVLLETLHERTPRERDQAGGVYDNPDLFRGLRVVEDPVLGRVGRVTVLSPRIDDGEPTGTRHGIEDESARLNLVVLLEWERDHPDAARLALMKLPGMTESIADAILDWIDADSVPRQFGAEQDFYAGIGVPYSPRDASVATLDELLLVRDVTRDLLFGAASDASFPRAEGESRGVMNRSAALARGDALPWASLLTVHSAERNLTEEGKPRIDLNDEDLNRLHRLLSGAFDESLAKFVIAYRQYGPYTGDALPAASEAFPLDLSRPAGFAFGSVLDVVGARIRLPSSPRQSATALASPIPNDREAARDRLLKLLDLATTRPVPVIRGRVNVNEAPRTVLLGVPGLGEASVERILAERRTIGATGAARRHPIWLWTEGLVDLAKMKDLLPYLNGGGDVIRAQVVGRFDDSGTFARVEVVLDATSSPARRVYWKNLGSLGLGYSAATLGVADSSRDASVDF